MIPLYQIILCFVKFSFTFNCRFLSGVGLSKQASKKKTSSVNPKILRLCNAVKKSTGVKVNCWVLTEHMLYKAWSINVDTNFIENLWHYFSTISYIVLWSFKEFNGLV